jgi:uncharacterized membrane protein
MTEEPVGERVGRLVGVDAARGVALLGMFAVHLLPATAADGSPTWTEELARGRSSAAFALLAGVALALAHGRRRPLRGSSWAAAAGGLAVRCGLIGLLGLLLGGLGSGLAIILTYYAVLFCLAIPLLGLEVRALAGVAVGSALLVPVLSHLVRGELSPLRGPSPVLSDLTEPGTLLAELTLTGYYPALAWVAYLAAGMAVGRLALDRRRVAVRLLLGGAALTLGALVVSAALTLLPAADEALPAGATERVLHGTTPPTTGWWLVTAEPHSSTPLDLATTIGSALALLGLMLLLAPLLGRVLLPLAWLGSMTLTLYTLHVLAVADRVGPSDPEQLWVVHVVAALVVATVWRSAMPRGPLEELVSRPSRRVAELVARR